MKECFITRRFTKSSQDLIEKANTITEEYALQDLILTLRQLYYQMVARDIIENTLRSYKRVVSIISDARYAGLIDWAAIEDRRRNLKGASHWDSPTEAVSAVADQYAIDKWQDQKYRPELYVEKEALLGILERVAVANDLQYMACCGYNSGPEMYNAAQRIRERRERGQETVIIYAGDHDPSGIDMSESDMPARFREFLAKYGQGPVEIRRVALNLDQVKQYNPPPNFAKEKDSRYPAYKKKYGEKCWEVDALGPATLIALYQAEIDDLKDAKLYAQMEEREAAEQSALQCAAERWDDVAEFLEVAI